MSLIEPVALSEHTVQSGDEVAELGPISLYNYGGCENLTLGQLVNAVCVHAGVALEDQTVNKMNVITVNSRRLKAESKIVASILDGSANYDSVLDVKDYEGMTYREFLVNVLGMEIGGDGTLPESVESYSDRMRVFTAMKEKLNSDATSSQQDMIDLQTYEARRDVAYSTATNVIKNIGMSKQKIARNLD